MKKLALLGTIGVLSFGILAGCSEDKDVATTGGEEKKTLVMGTSADYPPFEYIDTENGNEIIGFDVDLAKALAEEAGYKIEVKDIDFNGLLVAMKSGKVDMVMAGMSPTEERKENADFTDIYYKGEHLILSKGDAKVGSVEDLAAKTVGVQVGTVQEGKLDEIAETVKIGKKESRNRIPDLIQELQAGRFDAVIMEDTVAKGYLEKFTDLTSAPIPSDGQGGSAIAFPKDSELTAKFNEALKTLQENGTVDKLIVKWFDQQ